MPLLEKEGNCGATDPRQTAGMALNMGCVLGMMETVEVTVLAHCPVVGVNV
jgi:hypothetical protein